VISGQTQDSIQGIVERVTFHNESNGWSVLKVKCFNDFEVTSVIVHQTKVFAGATMKFTGNWSNHPKYGRQFTASLAEERKPASSAALEKYLGSGLIKGVGPKTAKRIVAHFGKNTLKVFEESIEDLVQVPLIAEKKLITIRDAWEEHKSIRDVMIFLQGHGISTLFAVRIFKKYGQEAIRIVINNPYRLANDFYGIGFFSADKVALSLGVALDAPVRIFAGIRHILAASREQGHCYLSFEQIDAEIRKLLELALPNLSLFLQQMEDENLLKKRIINSSTAQSNICYYSKTLYYDEQYSADQLQRLCRNLHVDHKRIGKWITSYNDNQKFSLSLEQISAIKGLVGQGCGILTGGPGCGKTTTTKTLVSLLLALGKKVMLAAPTGRAAQRMEEVIGLESKTIHRLLEFQNGGFKRTRHNPLQTDVLIVDECSMLDISLSAALLAAIPGKGQLILIGDADQLPSVGAGNVLSDILQSKSIPSFRLQTVFRQAQESFIVSYAHAINRGEVPRIDSPFKVPQLWKQHCDCLFIDSNEATQEQLRIIKKAKEQIEIDKREETYGNGNLYNHQAFEEDFKTIRNDPVSVKYEHVDFGLLQTAENSAVELRAVLKKTHPWSSLYYGLTASQVVMRLYSDWIPKYYGRDAEIQVLSPMTRGSLGTMKLNQNLQNCVNPATENKTQISLGERIFRIGDRVIHRKNNYDLGVYNGDIGVISSINSLDLGCTVRFLSDQRLVEYQKEQISELDLAYSITIHKSQGSEFDCVIIPLLSQHFKMLFRNLIYTGLTRAKKLAIFVGTRQALAMAVRNVDTAKRQTALTELLR
jgi:exodeoxyribonuclease V alpha subunit